MPRGNKVLPGDTVNLEYDQGFVDALEVVLEISKKHKANFVEKVGELWALAAGQKIEKIKQLLGFIECSEGNQDEYK
jgi:hypothetical protein